MEVNIVTDNDVLNMKSELNVYDSHGIKPNYHEIARKYNCDYRTVKKYHEGYQGKPKHRKKGSKLDSFKNQIEEKAMLNRITYRGIYDWLVKTHGYDAIGSYSNFKWYCQKNDIQLKNKLSGGTRYETEPGDMAQCDWKECIKLTNKSGEDIEVNVFHLVLKYSRYSYLELTLSREQPVVFRCLINAFNFFAGVPKRILFDNMSTVIDVNVTPKRVNEKMKQFAKDFNFEVQACKARHPYTKGTNESRNKIIDWIRPYNNEFETIEDLVEIVQKINTSMNVNVCQGTQISPCIPYLTEKEYLNRLPVNQLIDKYISPGKVKVSFEQLVYFEGVKYSVDKSYVGKYVSVEKVTDKLHFYYNGKLIQVHDVSNNPIVYDKKHYKQTMMNKVSQDKLEKVVLENLSIMDKLYNKHIEITKEMACQSKSGMIAYLCNQGYLSNWIKAFLSSLTNDQLEFLYDELKKTLPYVTDEKMFFSLFKNCADSKNLKYLRFNYLIEAIGGGNSFISEEWIEITDKDFPNMLYEHFKNIAESEDK